MRLVQHCHMTTNKGSHDPSNEQVPGVITVCVDVSDIEATKKEVEKLGPIHLLVNNAGVTEIQSFLDVTPEAYNK